MKKKILFLMPSMFIGGAERSLLGLLDAFDYDRYEVSLFLYRQEGEFLPYINKNVHILPEISEYRTFDVPVGTLIKKGKIRFALARIRAKKKYRMIQRERSEKIGIWCLMQCISHELQPLLPAIPGSYDAAISFLGVPETLLNKVNAPKKIAWNHTDYTSIAPDQEADRVLYSRIDNVVSVSDVCREQFLKEYPELENKAVVIENLISKSFVTSQAAEKAVDMVKKGNEITLLSVGRYTRAKNFDSIPAICRRIRENGYNVLWYIIGYGGDENIIKRNIEENGMTDYVILLGKKENPYPYIANCDLYVQPSRFEGKCVSVIEAQLLAKPVVITRYATSSSQLKEGYDGFIVPMDNDGCADEICKLLQNPDQIAKVCKNCMAGDYANTAEIYKLYKLIG